jgi:hypothetical protein
MPGIDLKNKVQKAAALIFCVIALTGCQEANKGSVPVDSRVGYPRTTGGAPTGSPVGISLNGIVVADSSRGQDQDDFNERVRDFMEASVEDRSYVGYVSGTPNDGTNSGVYIGGRVNVQGSSIDPRSQLVVAVFDAWPQEYGQVPALPQPYFTQAEGVIQGNEAHLRFYDDSGWVEMIGTFDSNNFVGEIYYDVQRTATGQMGHAGLIGQFSVPTCQFFNCQ